MPELTSLFRIFRCGNSDLYSSKRAVQNVLHGSFYVRILRMIAYCHRSGSAFKSSSSGFRLIL